MIDILYEDSNIIVINKPAGLTVHGDGRTEEKTLADFLLEQYPEMRDVGEPMIVELNGERQEIFRPGIVHRLDRGTSGVMLIAKNQESFLALKEQFQHHTIQKVYHAFVYGWLKHDEATIDEPIGRSPRDFRMLSAHNTARGELREAITDYKVLFRGSDIPVRDDMVLADVHKYSVVELYPKTGRTHQLRVHLKYINHPIVADELYAEGRKQAFGFIRPALHARMITFMMMNGDMKTIVAPYPVDFQYALEKIGLQM